MRGVVGLVGLFWKFSLDKGFKVLSWADKEWVWGNVRYR